jgi:sulfate permease, SulP family
MPLGWRGGSGVPATIYVRFTPGRNPDVRSVYGGMSVVVSSVPPRRFRVYIPKLVTVLREGYSRSQLVADLAAGLIVAVVALPLSIAFAIGSGVPPSAGIATAIVAGFLISAFGGSRVQIGGPTGAFVVIVYGIVQQYGVDGLAIATLIAGVLLVAMGLLRAGAILKFIPFPVVTGFTAGIAVVIFSGQVKDLLGLTMPAPPAGFVEKWIAYGHHLSSANLAAIVVSALTLAITLLWPRVSRTIPSPFVALVAATLLVTFGGLQVETIGSRFGEISAALPAPHLPHASWTEIRLLFPAGITIALLAAIESLLSAVVADGMVGGRHRSNAELIAQGLANFASPLFGGIPATGAIARTATNIRAGGRTPVAGITHAVALLLITSFFGGLASYIPLAALAAILVVVAYHMSEWRTFRVELTAPKSDVAVLLATFLLTVLIDLTVAIQVGMVLAAFLFMLRMAEVTQITAITELLRDEGEEPGALPAVPPGVEVFAVEGPFFFGAAEKFKETMRTLRDPPRVLVLEMKRVSAMDSTGLRAIADVVRTSRAQGTRVLLAGVHSQPMIALGRSHLLDEIGDENLTGSLEEALATAREHLAASPAAGAAA